jgi:hypothetical protein
LREICVFEYDTAIPCTTLFSVQYKMPAAQDIEIKQDMRVYALVPALIYCSPKFFSQYPTEARSVLSMFNSASDLLHYLLDEGHSWIAGRICGALQNIGKSHVAEEIKKTMESAGCHSSMDYYSCGEKKRIYGSARTS